jgi:hypothetical protein
MILDGLPIHFSISVSRHSSHDLSQLKIMFGRSDKVKASAGLQTYNVRMAGALTGESSSFLVMSTQI